MRRLDSDSDDRCDVLSDDSATGRETNRLKPTDQRLQMRKGDLEVIQVQQNQLSDLTFSFRQEIGATPPTDLVKLL